MSSNQRTCTHYLPVASNELTSTHTSLACGIEGCKEIKNGGLHRVDHLRGDCMIGGEGGEEVGEGEEGGTGRGGGGGGGVKGPNDRILRTAYI